MKFSIKAFLKSVYYKIIRLNDSPHNIAGGLAVGIFFGILPAVGAFAAVVIAHFLRVNRRAAFLGGLLTNTWLSFLTFVLAAKVGGWMTGRGWKDIYQQCKELLSDFKWREILDISTLDILKPLFVGYAVVGFVVAGMAYVAVRIGLNKYRAQKAKRGYRQI